MGPLSGMAGVDESAVANMLALCGRLRSIARAVTHTSEGQMT